MGSLAALPAFAGSPLRVAVVGAGLAGLVCAHKLAQQGITCELYESSLRIGGRVRTDVTSFTVPVDLGGEMIGGTHHYTRALAAELSVPLDFSGLSLGPVSATLKSAIAGDAADSVSVADWQLNKDDKALVLTLCPVITGLDPDVCALPYFLARTSLTEARDIADLLSYRYRVRGGADRLVTALKTPAPQLGYALEAVALRSDGRYVLSFGARELIADVVVLATPFNARIAVRVALPAMTQLAMNTVVYGTHSKRFSRVAAAASRLGAGVTLARAPDLESRLLGGRASTQPSTSAWKVGAPATYGFPTRAERLVFAGEHTAESYPGTMEGAVESGERAAAEVVKICSRAK